MTSHSNDQWGDQFILSKYAVPCNKCGHLAQICPKSETKEDVDEAIRAIGWTVTDEGDLCSRCMQDNDEGR